MTKTRNFSLSTSDWSEIYYALDSEDGVKAKIDEEGLTGSEVLTDVDWLEIYIACEEKLNRLRDGFYGRDSIAREWRKQFERIVGELDEIRAEYIGVEQCT
jgi:hypothetical protein